MWYRSLQLQQLRRQALSHLSSLEAGFLDRRSGTLNAANKALPPDLHRATSAQRTVSAQRQTVLRHALRGRLAHAAHLWLHPTWCRDRSPVRAAHLGAEPIAASTPALPRAGSGLLAQG